MSTNDEKTSTHPDRRWLIVSNRLPFKLDAEGRLSPGSGGLVTAIRGIGFDQPATWLGAAPDGVSREAFDAGVAALGDEAANGGNLGYEPVFIDADAYDAYYNRVCNDVLWPLLHYEAQELSFDAAAWEVYRAVNATFADAIVAVAKPGDVVWIHDYHLFLLPRMLRQRAPQLRVGFFLHVPFPSSEIFRQLPVREEVLESLLDADLVGFHDYDYLRHFCSAVAGLLGVPSNLVSIVRDDDHGEKASHVTELGVFPVSIDTARFREDALSHPAVEAHYDALSKEQHCNKLILGVDRCDYMKGIGLKLQAFERYLETHPEARDKVRLLQIAVPSRTDVPEYIRLRQSIEQHVSEINGKYGSPNFMPVHYIFNSVSYHELLALYRLADVLLITSKRDGMNLVAKEYIACQPELDPGVLVLSEFAGSSSVLSHALRINPWDIDQVSAQLDTALTASRAERIKMHAPMLDYLSSYTASTWARTFVESLASDSTKVRVRAEPWAEHADAVLERVATSRRLLLLVDYDGTLVPIEPEPELATLRRDTAERLRQAAARDTVDLVVISGRDYGFLERQLDGIDTAFACEHGARFCPRPGMPAETLVRSETASWHPVAMRIMRDFVLRTPDSRLEEKAFGIAWHYRNAPPAFADHQAQKLALELNYALTNLPASVIHGDKVVEVRPLEASKGLFLNWLLEQRGGVPPDTAIVAIGDDRTDEELFAALPPDAISIRIGAGSTQAQYQLVRQAQVLPLIEQLSAVVGTRAATPGLGAPGTAPSGRPSGDVVNFKAPLGA